MQWFNVINNFNFNGQAFSAIFELCLHLQLMTTCLKHSMAVDKMLCFLDFCTDESTVLVYSLDVVTFVDCLNVMVVVDSWWRK